MPIYEEEYDDYEQYEDYSYSEGDADEVEGGWEKARELLEEEVFFCAFLSSLEKSASKKGIWNYLKVPARYGEKGYGEHEYVYNGENEENGYGHGGNSQEVKLMKWSF